MKLYSKTKDYTLYNDNMLNMLDDIKEESIDSIICDPPYELNFMSKSWDNSGIAFNKDAWSKCFKVLKKGGYLLAFGGSRTFHRIACAIEDAGFEIRDTIMWLYGSGFPKSLNVGLKIDKYNGVESEVVGTSNCSDNKDIAIKQGNNSLSFGQVSNAERIEYKIKKAQNEWNGWGTCLKPAYEPIIVARKPVENSATENILKYGVGGINIDECRVEPTGEDIGRKNRVGSYCNGITMGKSKTPPVDSSNRFIGRFPSNVILTYDETDFDEVCGGMPRTENNSEMKFGSVRKKNDSCLYDLGFMKMTNKEVNDGQYAPDNYGDSGSVARYFYCAKASKKDRDEGLDEFVEKTVSVGYISKNKDTARKYMAELSPKRNIHPTVKPTNLMQYLVRLVNPKGATILDCFNGSGSTGKAVMYENKERNANYKYIGIEMTDEYLTITKARLDYVIENDVVENYDLSKYNAVIKKGDFEQLKLFDFGNDDL